MTGFPKDLPGANLVASGMEALQRGDLTIEALLVGVATRRLRAAGLQVRLPAGFPREPELELHRILAARHGLDTHSRYDALMRRLVRFERALESFAPLGSPNPEAREPSRRRTPPRVADPDLSPRGGDHPFHRGGERIR